MKINETGYGQLYHNLINRILKGEGSSTGEKRQWAFDNGGLPQPVGSLVNKVALQANKVTDADIEASKKAGLTEDELFELIICAAAGQASRQYESGLAALAEAMKEGGEHAS